MNFLRHSLMAAQMQGRQLGRRRVALVIVVLLPVALYFSQAATGPENPIAFGALGVAWALAAPSWLAGGKSMQTQQTSRFVGRPVYYLGGYRRGA